MLKAKKQILGNKSAFTLVEILVVIAILAILAVVTFVVINPIERINQANDTNAKEEVQSVLKAITFYTVDHNGTLPTYGSGTALPTVTAATVMTAGADVATLEGISPTYMTTLPDKGYRVGVLSSGAAIVGATLSDDTIFTKSE
jgi:prepilin-type N-terminal cleavage/methylation domain-containing protein